MDKLKEIELAKSFYVLAQLFTIIGGFWFAIGGIGWQNSTNLLFIINNIDNDILSVHYLENIPGQPIQNYIDAQFNLSESLSNTIQFTLSASRIYFLMGAASILLALLFWGRGYFELRKIKQK